MKNFIEILVCYDIESNRIRKKVSDMLKDFGLVSIQKSVYWGWVIPAEKKAILHNIHNKYDLQISDRVLVMDVNLASNAKSILIGYSDIELKRFEDDVQLVI
ncbi:CRISPR-associated endonuclease Cas2 [Leptospira fletcheri]|uniref:CRISPR-associated endoribonuclease Cas2 n=1 Tax=Leptospira fletcheri TaxID=2484981 RepID=A0A4R9GI52_9LEPT|nr:CRISPR-associated endonuclease Cas2 [Leptospira fletcheri]TGK12367.1 CRISPR-associated endonuclease Cas2 [Leptospira fletcheri]